MNRYVLVGPLVLLLLWFALTAIPAVSPVLLPSPLKVAAALWNLLLEGSVLGDLGKTVLLWLSGLAGGLALGIPVGVLMGYSPRIHAFFEIPIDFFRSLPSIVLYPLFIIFFGLGDAPKIAIVVMSSFLYTAVSTIYGVRYSLASRLMVARVLKANRWQTLSKVVLPGALPEIAAGIRISLSIALIVTVGSEMILGASAGLGKRVLDASLVYNMSDMYALVLLIGALGYASNRLAVLFEGRVIHWRGR